MGRLADAVFRKDIPSSSGSYNPDDRIRRVLLSSFVALILQLSSTRAHEHADFLALLRRQDRRATRAFSTAALPLRRAAAARRAVACAASAALNRGPTSPASYSKSRDSFGGGATEACRSPGPHRRQQRARSPYGRCIQPVVHHRAPSLAARPGHQHEPLELTTARRSLPDHAVVVGVRLKRAFLVLARACSAAPSCRVTVPGLEPSFLVRFNLCSGRPQPLREVKPPGRRLRPTSRGPHVAARSAQCCVPAVKLG